MAKHAAQRESAGGGEIDGGLFNASIEIDSFDTVLQASSSPANDTNASATTMVGTARAAASAR